MDTIKKALIPIIIIGLFGICVGWYFTWNYSADRYSGIIESKDATIQSQQVKIDQLKSTKYPIATPVRTVVIFDANGNVFNKHGDSELIKNVHVSHLNKENKLSELLITIESSHYLDSMPLLTHSQEVIYLMEHRRGIGNKIIFELHRTMYHGNFPALFKLEVY